MFNIFLWDRRKYSQIMKSKNHSAFHNVCKNKPKSDKNKEKRWGQMIALKWVIYKKTYAKNTFDTEEARRRVVIEFKIVSKETDFNMAAATFDPAGC